jgi:ABC-type transport system substrate-binding protein
LGQGVFDTTLKPYETAAFNMIRANRQFAFGMLTNGAAFNEPDVWFDQVYRTGASRNYWNFSDPSLDAMFDKQRTLFDLRERRATVREIVTYMIDHWPGVIPANPYWLTAIKPSVQNFYPEGYVLHGSQYQHIWRDD